MRTPTAASPAECMTEVANLVTAFLVKRSFHDAKTIEELEDFNAICYLLKRHELSKQVGGEKVMDGH